VKCWHDMRWCRVRSDFGVLSLKCSLLVSSPSAVCYVCVSFSHLPGGRWQFAYRKDSRQKAQENREEVVHTAWRWVRHFCRTVLFCLSERCQLEPLSEAFHIFWEAQDTEGLRWDICITVSHVSSVLEEDHLGVISLLFRPAERVVSCIRCVQLQGLIRLQCIIWLDGTE
jgi:hypothetical protein